jgi:biopolymer transport protein ExbD
MVRPQINVTPLIDVLLVLLIIFMVVSPAKPSRFDAKIPQVSQDRAPAVPNPETLIVIVGEDSALKINKQADMGTVSEPGKMIEALANTFRVRRAIAQSEARNPDEIERTVFIKARSLTTYGDVAKVVDAVKMAGAFPISLAIDDLD